MVTERAILEAFEQGDPRGLARAITRCESGAGAGLIHALHARAGAALTIGLTGPPGVGKSTLTAALVRKLRTLDRRVGVISVDPSSPFSHGALLGDRIRLSEHFLDPAVFIRSMASRGHLGGVAGATADAVALMDAFGLQVVIVETVGVGQSELEIAELADTTIVALQPGSGDSVQTLKAGILEIADVFVVNKADHPMALQLQREIRSMLEMLDYSGWPPPLVATQAVDGNGIDELWAAIEAHHAYLRRTGELAVKRRAAFAHRVRQLALGAIERRLDAAIDTTIGAPAAHESPIERDDPYAIADRITAGLMQAREPVARVAPVAYVRARVRGL
ncbi:MAG: methylmalonyl Co-A mutase-associated GTPase MeaB [Vulcanimicrobiaceae bacterium]